MKTCLIVLSCFTAAASCWLVVMYVVLQHPGYEWRAAMATLFVIQSVLTVAALAGWADGGWVRGVLLAGAAAILLAGGSAVRATLAGDHFEGFALVIGLALVIQGALTLVIVLRQRPFELFTAPQR
jgi:hypothetical protein